MEYKETLKKYRWHIKKELGDFKINLTTRLSDFQIDKQWALLFGGLWIKTSKEYLKLRGDVINGKVQEGGFTKAVSLCMNYRKIYECFVDSLDSSKLKKEELEEYLSMTKPFYKQILMFEGGLIKFFDLDEKDLEGI